MSKWGVLWVAWAAWLTLAAAPALALAASGSVSGVITNWYQVKDKVSPKAYFQFVKKEEKLASSTDKEGLGAITSNLPGSPSAAPGVSRPTPRVCLQAIISLPCSGVCRRRPSWSRTAAR